MSYPSTLKVYNSSLGMNNGSGGGGDSGVKSWNGMTGDVVATASDVNAFTQQQTLNKISDAVNPVKAIAQQALNQSTIAEVNTLFTIYYMGVNIDYLMSAFFTDDADTLFTKIADKLNATNKLQFNFYNPTAQELKNKLNKNITKNDSVKLNTSTPITITISKDQFLSFQTLSNFCDYVTRYINNLSTDYENFFFDFVDEYNVFLCSNLDSNVSIQYCSDDINVDDFGIILCLTQDTDAILQEFDGNSDNGLQQQIDKMKADVDTALAYEIQGNQSQGVIVSPKANNKQTVSMANASKTTKGVAQAGTNIDANDGVLSTQGGGQGTVKTVAGVPADAGGNVPLKASDISAYTKAQTDLAVAGVAAECTNLQTQLNTTNTKLTEVDTNMKKITSAPTVNGIPQEKSQIDGSTFELPVKITIDQPGPSFSNGIQFWDYTGQWVTDYDINAFPSAPSITQIKQPLPTKELNITLQKIMPSYYPDSFYYFLFALNTSRTIKRLTKTAVYGGYNINWNDVIATFGGSNTLPFVVRFTNLITNANVDITVICDKTTIYLKTADSFAGFISSEVAKDSNYVSGTGFKMQWNGVTNRFEMSANYNATFSLTLSPSGTLANKISLTKICYATWTVASVMNVLQSGTPVLKDIQDAITANPRGELAISFNFSVSGELPGLFIKMEDVPSLSGLADIMTAFMRSKTATKDAYPNFTMTYDGNRFNISNGTVNQILISPNGLGNDLLKISQAGFANISVSNDINVATDTFSATRVSYQVTLIEDVQEAIIINYIHKINNMQHDLFAISLYVYSQLVELSKLSKSDLINTFKSLFKNEKNKLLQTFKSHLLNEKEDNIDELYLDILNDLSVDINAYEVKSNEVFAPSTTVVLDNEYITCTRINITTLMAKPYLCLANQSLIRVTAKSYTDKGMKQVYPNMLSANYTLDGSTTAWCLTDVLSEFGEFYINQLHEIFFDGRDVNQGGSNGNIVYYPVNIPLNQLSSGTWQKLISFTAQLAVAKVVTLRIIIVAVDDNLVTSDYLIPTVKKTNGKIMWYQDIKIPATGTYPNMPDSQNDPLITITSINYDIVINTSWSNSNNSSLSLNSVNPTYAVSLNKGQCALKDGLNSVIDFDKMDHHVNLLNTITTDILNRLVTLKAGVIYKLFVATTFILNGPLQNPDPSNPQPILIGLCENNFRESETNRRHYTIPYQVTNWNDAQYVDGIIEIDLSNEVNDIDMRLCYLTEQNEPEAVISIKDTFGVKVLNEEQSQT
jgi:hypothetical protein